MRFSQSVWAAALCTILLAGCTTTEEHLQPVDLVKFEPTVALERVWSRNVLTPPSLVDVPRGRGVGPSQQKYNARWGGTTAARDERYPQIELAIEGDRVYAAGVDGVVVSVEQETGKTVWRKDVNTALGGAVSADSGLVLMGSLRGEVIALAIETGEELWRAETSSEVLASPQTNGDVVIASTIDGKVFAFDARTGQRLWSYDHPTPVLTLRSMAAPLVHDEQVYVAFDNGQLVSFAASDGQLRWSARVSQPTGRTELERIIDIDATPILRGSFVYTASYNGRIVAVNRGTGRVVWAQEASTYHNLALGGGKVLLADEDSHINAYDATTGALAWQNEQLHRRDIGPPQAFGDYVVVVDASNFLHLLSLEDGSFAARLELSGAGYRSQPVSHNDKLFVYSDDGKLTVYRVADYTAESRQTRGRRSGLLKP